MSLIIHSNKYADWVFNASHPTQGRRFINAKKLLEVKMGNKSNYLSIVEPRLATKTELSRVHSSEYIDAVLENHVTHQWTGARPDLSALAALFAGGTLVALDALITGKAKTAIHFPGAKHHAQYDHSSGFCVFADFALAADIATKDFSMKVAILDFDAHHGDGTENLTANNLNVMSFSIHEKGIFPGTGLSDDPEQFVFNAPLDTSTGKGDHSLLTAVKRFIRLNQEFKADLLFIAAGADGHSEDPLSTLQFSLDGYCRVACLIRDAFPEVPILVGGAGGYLPDSRTPEVWSSFAHHIAIK
jgi:acetoin utilization protein AcuC